MGNVLEESSARFTHESVHEGVFADASITCKLGSSCVLMLSTAMPSMLGQRGSVELDFSSVLMSSDRSSAAFRRSMPTCGSSTPALCASCGASQRHSPDHRTQHAVGAAASNGVQMRTDDEPRACGSLGDGGSFSFNSSDVILAKRDFDGVGDVKPAPQTPMI